MTSSVPTAVRRRFAWRSEWFIAVAAATCAIFWASGGAFFAGLANPFVLAAIFAWLFAVIVGSAFNAMRHAERLATIVGEPSGTLILTLSVTFIEVMSISAVMLHGDPNPTLVRDTLISVIMIGLNGLVGLSLLIGALRHREQTYNLQGANTYLGVIVPLAVMSVILPDYTVTTAAGTLSPQQRFTLAVMSIGLYVTFLAIQIGRHRRYFMLGEETGRGREESEPGETHRTASHVAMLAAYLVPVVYLAEQLAHPVDFVIETLGQPTMLGGVAIALLVISPEGLGAVRAAAANQLQRSINILFGSVLSSIGLTVPIMLAVVHFAGLPIVLGVEHANLVLLTLTLGLSVVTFSSGRTNLLQGFVHMLLFIAFLLLIIEG